MEPHAIEGLQRQNRARRYWMKVQQKLDRALESYVRLNYTDWTEAEDKKAREREAKRALTLVKAAKDGDGPVDLISLVIPTIKAREPVNSERQAQEKAMEKIAMELPVYSWVQSVPGFGALGLATIISLTGDLNNYATVGKVWKRLMLAPYDGLAGSTWKRESWRPRSLTNDEWKANPFSGERYALVAMIADSLHKHQIQGKEKSGTIFGKPLGPYGAVYVKRREATANRGWTLMHAHRDALRIMVKTLVRDLWIEWRSRSDATFINQPWVDGSPPHQSASDFVRTK